MIDKTIAARLAEIRHLALDMDGTIYQGGTLFDFTVPFLKDLRTIDVGFTFLTNNSSLSGRDYLKKLEKFQLEVQAEQIFTAGMGTLEYLRANLPEYQRLFVLGTRSLREEFSEAGYELVDDVAQGDPDAVIVAFDTELVYDRLCLAGYWIARGKPFIATHPDPCCPTDQPTLLVDCGALTACLEKASGRKPDLVLGKPHSIMLQGIMRRYDLQPRQIAMIGDRLATDIQMARNADCLGVLVLTGEATAESAANAPDAADLVVADLAEFGELLIQSKTGAG